MKIEKARFHTKAVVSFSNWFVRYSRVTTKNLITGRWEREYRFYQLQLKFPFTKIKPVIYKARIEPPFTHNINLIAAIYLLSLPVLAVGSIAGTLVYVLTAFYKAYFFDELRHMSFTEKLSGLVSLILTLIGLIAIISWL